MQNVIFRVSDRKKPLEAIGFYFFHGIAPVWLCLLLGKVSGSPELGAALLTVVTFAYPAALTYFVVKSRGFPSKYYWLILLSLALVFMAGVLSGGLLAAMIVPAGLTSRRLSVKESA